MRPGHKITVVRPWDPSAHHLPVADGSQGDTRLNRLFERLGEGDSILQPIGRAHIPAHSILADLDNAGHIVARGDTIWFAPFIRDEVIAMTCKT